MQEIVFSLKFFFMFLTFLAFSLSFLYLKGIHKTNLDFGINLPQGVQTLLMANVLLSLAGLLVIGISMFF